MRKGDATFFKDPRIAAVVAIRLDAEVTDVYGSSWPATCPESPSA